MNNVKDLGAESNSHFPSIPFCLLLLLLIPPSSLSLSLSLSSFLLPIAIPVMSKRGRSSDVWDFYDNIKTVQKPNGVKTHEGKCKLCETEKFVTGPSTSNFIIHLQDFHNESEEYREYTVRLHSKSKSGGNVGDCREMSRIDSHFAPTGTNREIALMRSASYLSAAQALSISLFESDAFQQFLRDFAYDTRNVQQKLRSLSRKNIRRSVISEGRLMLLKSLNLMKQSFVSLLVDGGTIHTFGSKSTNIDLILLASRRLRSFGGRFRHTIAEK